MAWPKGRPRPRRAQSTSECENAPPVPGDEPAPLAQDAPLPVESSDAPQAVETPPDWRKGALLNVRNYGAEYIITLYPEEYDARHEERCIRFTNLGLCQDFVSHWYARESHDPRAR